MAEMNVRESAIAAAAAAGHNVLPEWSWTCVDFELPVLIPSTRLLHRFLSGASNLLRDHQSNSIPRLPGTWEGLRLRLHGLPGGVDSLELRVTVSLPGLLRRILGVDAELSQHGIHTLLRDP